MSTDELRRELDRIAGSAPAADVPDDTWTRARRSVVRDRVAVVAAGFAVVATVAAGVTWLPDRIDPPVADSGPLGVPDHLYEVPERMSARDIEDIDNTWIRDEVTTDLDIGIGAAAWRANDLPVVVDADDGDYHLLNLPGYGGNNFYNQLYPATIALSPDGTKLAYSWATFGPDAEAEPIPSGVRVADLTTGDVVEFPLEGFEGTAVANLAWSASGRWVAFAGQQMGSWTAQSSATGDGQPVVGRIDLVQAEIDALQGARLNSISVGVDDSGVVALGSDGRLRFWDGSRITRAAVASPMDNRLVASPEGVWVLPGPGSVTVIDGEEVRDIALRSGGQQGTRPLGWVGSDIVVAVPSDGGWHAVELVPGVGGVSHKVADVEGDVRSLSLAVDLMSGDDPTVERPEPDWPWSEERWAVTIGIGVLLVGAAALLARRYRAAR